MFAALIRRLPAVLRGHRLFSARSNYANNGPLAGEADRRAGRARIPKVSVPGAILGRVATVTMVTVERSGPAIRAALAAYTPEDEARFTGELREALARAGQDLDLAGPQAVLRRWHARAVMAANPLSAEEQAQIERAKAGDFTGFSVRHDDGSWTTL